MARKKMVVDMVENTDGIVYGSEELVYSADKALFAKGSHEHITNDIDDIKRQYVNLGFHLSECYHQKYYECFGYSKFYDYVQANFGMDKSATSRCINVYLEFSKCNEQGTHFSQIDDKWKDYSYTQLCEMLPMSEEEREAVTPDMSAKAIRELKKAFKTGSKLARPSAVKVASTQPETAGEWETYVAFRRAIRETTPSILTSSMRKAIASERESVSICLRHGLVGLAPQASFGLESHTKYGHEFLSMAFV